MPKLYALLDVLRRCAPRSVKDNLVPARLKKYFYRERRAALQREWLSAAGLLNQLDQIAATPFEQEKQGAQLTTHSKPSRDGAIIEINNSCNINCRMCDTKSSSRTKAMMDLALFERLIATLAKEGAVGVELHTIGDPLANKQLRSYLEIVRKHKFTVGKLSSNFLLYEKHADTLFEFADVLRTLRVSVDAASKDTYEFIRAGGNWDLLHKNLKAFVERNNASGRPLEIFFSHTVNSMNYAELAYIPQVFSYVSPPENHTFGFISSLSPNNDFFHEYNFFKDKYYHAAPCPLLWGGLYVLQDGSVTACCRDYDGSLIYNKIAAGQSWSSDDIINSPKIQEMRRTHIEGDVQNMPELCRSCYIADGRWGRFLMGVINLYYDKAGGEAEPEALQAFLDKIRPALEAGTIAALKEETARFFA